MQLLQQHLVVDADSTFDRLRAQLIDLRDHVADAAMHIFQSLAKFALPPLAEACSLADGISPAYWTLAQQARRES